MQIPEPVNKTVTRVYFHFDNYILYTTVKSGMIHCRDNVIERDPDDPSKTSRVPWQCSAVTKDTVSLTELLDKPDDKKTFNDVHNVSSHIHVPTIKPTRRIHVSYQC